VKYQIACDISFDKQTDRDEVFIYLHGKKDLAFSENGNMLVLENCIDGSYRVACTYRLTNQADRDEIETYLKGKKSAARADKEGYIEKHTCEHDAGKACGSQVLDNWGGEVI
jgi:hypothetical protein